MALEPPPQTPASDTATIDEALARYSLRRVGESSPIADSVLNRNYRVETGSGAVFVRIHNRKRTRDRLEVEHRAIAWAGDHGLPVNAPLAANDGRTIVGTGGSLVAVFPWVEGRTARRGGVTPGEAAILGATHGLLHATLTGYADPELPTGKTGSTWDTAESIDDLGRVDDLLRYYPALPPALESAQMGLRHQLSLLESGAARPIGDFAALPMQPCHGDYHERNVLLTADGSVAAVVDWEMVGLMPRIFELWRCLSFVGMLEEPLFGAYLRAYREHVSLDAEEVRLGLEMWWQSMLHDTWIYRARFIDGNRAAEQFFRDDIARVGTFSDRDYREHLAARMLAAIGSARPGGNFTDALRERT